MKKLSLLLVLIISNLSIISCTEQSLSDSINPDQETLASDGDNDNSDPKEEPIGG